MSQRLLTTKWLWYLLALQAGSLWGQARTITVKTPPKNPSTIEAQAKFFQDFFSVQLSPYKIEFGHVCEDPNTWEQRYEKKDFKNHRDMGKVRWGDKKGGYGEHYWDLNHAGHAGNHGNDGYDGDDGSYHEPSSNDPYDNHDHHDSSPNYNNDEYEPEKSSYEENGRAKRAHPKVKIDRKAQKENHDEEAPEPPKKNRRNKEQQAEKTHDEEEEEYPEEEEEEVYEKPKSRRQHYRKQEDNPAPKEKNQLVLVVSQKDDSEKQPSQYVAKKQPDPVQYVKKPEIPQYVPYEGGAGVRQHQPEITPTHTVPRLFLEPSTGHVVDRATGQAYVLQPIAVNKYN